jgi:hypothetical protein
MTDDRLPLADLLAKAGDGDFLRSVAEAVLQMPMEADVEGLIGAGRHERTGARLPQNGHQLESSAKLFLNLLGRACYASWNIRFSRSRLLTRNLLWPDISIFEYNSGCT